MADATSIETADDVARLLASGQPVSMPVALVVAHPDDEVLWAGSALARLRNLKLIHVTDGAPRDMADAHRLGFARRDDYAEARMAELDRALDALSAAPERSGYAIADQETIFGLSDLVDRLERVLAGCKAVLTHPYEGGHPDHDTIALAVRIATDRLGRRGRAPDVIEFACYHRLHGERVFGRFWPDPRCPERRRTIPPAERVRVDAAIAAHATQAAVIGDWRPDAERWRAAPAYDFAAPPPPGQALYDGFGWKLTSACWHRIAAEALAAELQCA